MLRMGSRITKITSATSHTQVDIPLFFDEQGSKMARQILKILQNLL